MPQTVKDDSRPERPLNGRARHLGFLLTLLVGLPLMVPTVWPQVLGAQRAPLIAQLIAFRMPLVIGLGAIAVIAAVVALLRRRWATAAAIAVCLGLASLANGLVIVDRGTDAAIPEGDLTVVAWNTQGGATPPRHVADLILATDADIVSLPEMDEQAAAEVERLVAASGYRMTSDTTYGDTGDSWIPTSVLIADHLGDYRIDDSRGSTPGLPSAVWRPVNGSGPAIVAAHPYPPLFSGMDHWRAGLNWIAKQCDSPDVIVAGDLNATVDHMTGLGTDEASLIGVCQDAALQAGNGASGTWPSTVPRWMAAPIDHVLVGRSWTAIGAEIVDTPADGTDHRPIVAVLQGR